MRALLTLLALLREKETAERPITSLDLQGYQIVLCNASINLTILAPELGDQELIKSVAAQLANLRSLGGRAIGRVPRQ